MTAEVATGVTTTPQPPSFPTPLLVEVIGEPESGKTHFVSGFPRPFMIDTTAKGESRTIFLKVTKDPNRYVQASNWNELVMGTKMGLDRQDVATIIIDTGANLQPFARDEYIKRGTNRKGALQFEYGRIRDMLDAEFTFKVTALPPAGRGKNLVVTSQLKTQYRQVMDASNNVVAIKDGRQRDGYARLDFQSDVRLHFELKAVCKEHLLPPNINGICPTCGKRETRIIRNVQVVKNRFMDKAGDGWIDTIKPTWTDFKRLLNGEVIVE